jgi:hypothetical protein
VGQIAAHKWGLQIKSFQGAEGCQKDCFFYRQNYPIKKGKSSCIRLDDTILPERQLQEVIDVGFQLSTALPMQEQLATLFQTMRVNCHLALEIGSGIAKSFDVSPVAQPNVLSIYIMTKMN